MVEDSGADRSWLRAAADVMLHSSHYIVTSLPMSIGSSGRIVIEVEPEVKRQLYSTLAREGMTLKDWFLREAQNYMKTATQMPLDLISDVKSADQTKNTL